MPARPALLLLIALGACAPRDAAPPPRDEAADALLAHVTGDAFDEAFAALDALPHRVRRQSARNGGGHSSEDRSDSTGVAAANPLGAFLSDEPPYLDAAARDQYAVAVVGDTLVAGRRAPLVEARYREASGRAQPIQYVRAAVADGRLLHVHVRRSSESLLYDEQSWLTASLQAAPGGALVPAAAQAITETDVPLSPPRAHTVAWEVSLGAAP